MYALQESFRLSVGQPVRVVSLGEAEGANAQIVYTRASTSLPAPQLPRHLWTESPLDTAQVNWSMKGDVPIPLSPEREGMPVDLVACIAWCLTCAEEYTAARDAHGRFDEMSSDRVKQGWHQLPLCHLYADLLRDYLNGQGFNFAKPLNQWQFRPTADVDVALAFGGRQWWRQLGSFLKRPGTLFSRLRVARGKQPDPYDTFDMLIGCGVEPRDFRLFMHVGGYHPPYDASIDFTSNHGARLLDRLKETGVQWGLHPSYTGGQNAGQIQREKFQLEQLIGAEVRHSRHHYLRIFLPSTFRELIKAEITDDYSMGYATTVGFRCGTIIPYKWFDLAANSPTELVVHPAAIMDGPLLTCTETVSQAVERAMKLANATAPYGGEFTLIWHNTTLSEPQWMNGRENLYSELTNALANFAKSRRLAND